MEKKDGMKKGSPEVAFSWFGLCRAYRSYFTRHSCPQEQWAVTATTALFLPRTFVVWTPKRPQFGQAFRGSTVSCFLNGLNAVTTPFVIAFTFYYSFLVD